MTNKFLQSLGTSLNRGSTVLRFSHILKKQHFSSEFDLERTVINEFLRTPKCFLNAIGSGKYCKISRDKLSRYSDV